MNEFPQRKNPRLNGYDYSRPGCYFITICTSERKSLMSSVVTVGRPLAAAVTELTETGRMVETQLLALENRYPYVNIEKYVIMPDHLHVLLSITEDSTAGPRSALPDIVRAFKSNCGREWNRMQGTKGEKLFQTSYNDHVIRNRNDYEGIWKYIDENPLKEISQETAAASGRPTV